MDLPASGRLLRRFRGLRWRLVVIFTGAALLVALAGALAFTLQLRRGLLAGIDSSLDTRAAPMVTALAQSGAPDLPDAPPTVTRNNVQDVDSLSLVARPDGSIADSQPLALAQAPLGPRDFAAAHTAARRVTTSVQGREFRFLLVPVHRAEGVWVVAVGTTLDPVAEATSAVTGMLWIAGPLLLVVVASGAWLLSGAALRPVERMRADAERISSHDPISRLTVPGTGDELAALADTLNGLLGRLNQSLTRQRELVADAGHELRTPLAILRAELELAARPQRTKAELQSAVLHAVEEVDRLSALSDDLLFLARYDGGQPLVQPQRDALRPVLAASVSAHRTPAAESGVRLDLTCDPDLEASLDARALRRAVDNLLSNAIRHAPAGSRVGVSVAALPAWVVISVTDEGIGFPNEFLPFAFERFRRPDSARQHDRHGRGAGLGLAIVQSIALAHGGRAVAENRRGSRGARVSVLLPNA